VKFPQLSLFQAEVYDNHLKTGIKINFIHEILNVDFHDMNLEIFLESLKISNEKFALYTNDHG
jgi:hypothetical protein